MYPILFSISKVNFYTHGLMIALGVLLGGGVIFYLARKEQLATKSLIDLFIYSLFAGIIGARIVYVIAYYYQFSNWKEMFHIWYGGLVSFGGIIFAFLTAGFILRKKGQSVLKWFDISTPGFFLGWAIAKVGCFLSGDTPGSIGKIPVTLFEAGWVLLIVIISFYILIWKKPLLQRFNHGVMFFTSFAVYFSGRAIYDNWRIDPKVFLSLNYSQIASAISFLVLLGVIFFITRKKMDGGYNV